MVPKWLRAVKAVFLCFDVTRRDSFDNLSHWVQLLDDLVRSSVAVFLFETKCDLPRVVSEEKALKFASQLKVPLLSVGEDNRANI